MSIRSMKSREEAQLVTHFLGKHEDLSSFLRSAPEKPGVVHACNLSTREAQTS